MRRLAAVAALAVMGATTIGACAGGSGGSPGEGSSGIRGVVLAGPQCPVETPESPCPPKPLPGVRVEVRSGGDVVADVMTDDRGEFSVFVDPGTYDVQAAPGQQGFMGSKPVRVVVASGAFTRIDVPVDTGIR
jgi:Carboxypeptidase regulatory-like domain